MIVWSDAQDELLLGGSVEHYVRISSDLLVLVVCMFVVCLCTPGGTGGVLRGGVGGSLLFL